MTIALGFLCPDGIVLGADTQLTAEGSHKGYECKLFPHQFPKWSAVVTYAGSPDFVKAFNGRLHVEMENAAQQWELTPSVVHDVVIEILRLFSLEESANTELLCGFTLPNVSTFILKTKGTLVSEVHGHAYIGAGDSSVVRYLLPLLTRHGVNASAQQAALVGTYIIRVAKMYVDGCGGDTDMVILRPSGTLQAGSGQTTNAEQHQGMIEYFVSDVMSVLALGMNESEFESRLALMSQRLRSERTELMRFFSPTRPPNLR
jgi:hypothetical protein